MHTYKYVYVQFILHIYVCTYKHTVYIHIYAFGQCLGHRPLFGEAVVWCGLTYIYHFFFQQNLSTACISIIRVGFIHTTVNCLGDTKNEMCHSFLFFINLKLLISLALVGFSLTIAFTICFICN